MYAAIAAAELGDEQRREDPTVNELQRRAAELLGQEAALFVPTATMANQIALRLLGTRGGELLAEERTHVLVYESGGAAAHSGLVMRGIAAEAGWLTPAHLQEWAGLCDGILQPPSVVVLEQTHRSAGGRVWPLDLFQRTVARPGSSASASISTARGSSTLPLRAASPQRPGAASPTPSPSASPRASAARWEPSSRRRPSGSRRPGAASSSSAARSGRRAWSRRRCSTPSTTTSNGSPTTTGGRAGSRTGLPEAALPVDPAATESNFVAIDVRPLGLGTSEAVARIAESVCSSRRSGPASCARSPTSASTTRRSRRQSTRSRRRSERVSAPEPSARS